MCKTSRLPWWQFDPKQAFKACISAAIIATVVMVGGGTPAAYAQGQGLAAVAPVDPANGFPQLYQDRTGQKLGPCLNTSAANPCGLAGTIPNPALPISFPNNFPSEFFYWNAVAVIKSGNFRATLTMALEGTFGNATGAVVDGQQIVFARFRFRTTGGKLTPGATYTLTHPFGVKTFVAAADATINFTDDQGCTIAPPACNFGTVLTSTNVGPFLKWDATAPAPPAGFIGDGVTPHKITGSPFGTNFARLDGPNVGGNNKDTIQIDLFTVMGQISTASSPTPLTVDRTSFSRTVAGGSEIDLLAHTVGNGTLIATGTGIPNTTLTTDPATGRAGARIVLAPGAALPTTISYTASSPGSTATVSNNPLIDEVTVATATYSQASGSLTVNATSSDQVGTPTLSAAGNPSEPLGTLTAGTLTTPLVAPPFQVNVTSSEGGTDKLLVDLTQ